ncbi:MAG TPA: ATP-dependent RNA helicase HrpA [Burkholderiales bacterium]|nr:ATP-dependent RNA helicase HrpA [Burkholderiales bacterium]
MNRLSPAALAARRANLPRPEFPPELPVSARRAEIARAIQAHQVVIVCGETGSGKTTQLPKICLELGRGVGGLIGHTQPRRIAARATAARIAYELGTELGRAVGFKIRFTDRTSQASYLKLMTDGILLAETQGDPELRQYDTLIVDEAHERSLNIDFLLGYLKQLLPRRPDLKVIVTSATLDADRFARHFDDAPVIEVSGRLYPVEIRYRPPQRDADGEVDLDEAIADAVDECAREGPGDVLVFLPGEREIREAAETLRKHHPPRTEILPLYARLAARDQERVFKAHPGRRIVLATNVAETSLTVPGIRYVVDPGLARVKRYSYRHKVEQLQVERISQAAAKQRAGRCGRVAAGVCIRIYDEEDFGKRPAFTDPEVLRSSLAAVILRMKSLGLGAVEAFPFIEPPAPRAIADGYALLQELGAVDDTRELTEVGSALAKLPLDPRIGRMVLAAKEEVCLPEALIIAAALAVQDPRERPLDRAQAADEAQKKFADEKSDFLSYLKLWRFFDEGIHHDSNRKLHQACREHFLSFNRMREWRDVQSQLKELVGDLGWKVGEPARDAGEDARIHRALLAGLLGNVGLRTEEGNYLGARGIKFWVHPGSVLAKKAPRWIMAAELTETTRLFARCVAGIAPEWLERIGGHLVKRSQSDPHWEKQRAEVVAVERGTLYGLPVYVNRRVSYGTIDPVASRELFIREALIAGEWESRAPFFQHNRRLVREIEALEHKSRRPDVLVDEELIYAFYDSLIPAAVCNGAGFEAWRRDAERTNPKRLFLKRDDLMRHEAAGITTAQFPHTLELGGRTFALEYLHDPGGSRDGVTMTVPLIALNQVSTARCEWLVPGLLKDKVQLLAKSLPQKVRHQLGPLGDFAAEFAASVPPTDTPLAQAIARYARESRNLALPPEGFRPETLPAHLGMNFRIIDEHGRQLAMGRNLAQLRAELGDQAGEQFAAAAGEGAAIGGLTDWSFDELEEVMEVKRGSQTLIGYPALVDRGAAVDLEVFDSPDGARAAHHGGVRRLFMLQLKEQAKYIEKNLPGIQAMTLQYGQLGDAAELKAQLVTAAFERTCMADPLPRNRESFVRRRDEARTRVALIAQEIARLVAMILAERQALVKKLQAAKAFPDAVRDIEAQLARLMPKDFVAATPWERLQHFPRYLKAAASRLDKLRADPSRDARAMAELVPLATQWLREDARQRKGGSRDPQLDQFRWLLEELRVQLFAQELRTPVPVSTKRLQRMWVAMKR